MRFQVPQYIEVEDKIFGPLTFKQFIYLGGGVGVTAVLFILLPKFFALLISVPIVIFALALAFFKVNDKPFIGVAEAFFKYSLGPKLYIWKKREKQAVPKTPEERRQSIDELAVPRISNSKLKELTWQLDVKNSANPVTENDKTI